jgi:hypothetical protein
MKFHICVIRVKKVVYNINGHRRKRVRLGKLYSIFMFCCSGLFVGLRVNLQHFKTVVVYVSRAVTLLSRFYIFCMNKKIIARVGTRVVSQTPNYPLPNPILRYSGLLGCSGSVFHNERLLHCALRGIYLSATACKVV